MCFVCRPGFTRINFPYFLDEDALDFTLEAVKLVAEHGWKLLPQVHSLGVKLYFTDQPFSCIILYALTSLGDIESCFCPYVCPPVHVSNTLLTTRWNCLKISKMISQKLCEDDCV